MNLVTARLLIEVALFVLLVTQLVLPLVEDTPMFPMFRRKSRRRLEIIHQIQDADEDLVQDDLNEQLTRLRARHEQKATQPAAEEKATDADATK